MSKTAATLSSKDCSISRDYSPTKMSSTTDSDDSSDSDYSMRARMPSATSTTSSSADTKNKTKKKPMPQEKINQIWERFSAPQFGKATTILPFATPTSKSSPDPSTKEIPKPERSNLLVSEDFERAVQECRKRVQKLIKECRRVNMRYRDPDFDLDWDLKWDKGNCLNGLGTTKFRISKRSDSTSTSVPKSVKRVHEIFEKPTFLQGTISPADVKQGNLGNCWQIGSLTAMANLPGGIQRICVEYDCKVGIYGFVFLRDGDWIVSIIDDKLYLNAPDWDSHSMQRSLLERNDREDVETEYRKTYQTGSQCLFFAQCRDQNETWLPLLEKAYAKAHGDYAALAGGWIGEGLEDLTGGVTTELLTSDLLDTEEFWTNEIMNVNKEFLFGCSTGLLDGDFGYRKGIAECHAYILMEARIISTGQRLVKLRNPWGKVKRGVWEGAWSDGSKEFTPEIQLELDHKFGADSVFWISYEDFLRKFQHLDRTRLFMDSPEWRVTQKWISVEVPWKAEFEQKFRLVLTKESPLVLVLSQLDDRYFRGLQGQYNFRLQFRLHEIDSPDENDYLVRSHGNYIMERSVVAELKSIPTGTYALFIQVVAERKICRDSVEAVIKHQTRKRTHNDKLASVGMSYDLAHSKALVHLQSKATRRAEEQKVEARTKRNTTRHKDWEKRHLTRKITRKQEKKNRRKLDRRDARIAAKEKEGEDAKPKDESVQTEDVEEVLPSKEDRGIQTEDPSTSSAAPEDPEAAKTTETSEKTNDTQPPVMVVDNDKSTSADGNGTETTTKSDNQDVVTDTVKDSSTDDTLTIESKTVTEPEISDSVIDAEKGAADDMSVSDGGSQPDTPNGSQDVFTPGEETSTPAGLLTAAQDYFQDKNAVPLPLAPTSVPTSEPIPATGSVPTPEPTNPEPTPSPASETPSESDLDVSSDGESSASPVSDFGDLSEDEPVPAPAPATKETKDKGEGEEGAVPEPWNAICIVGLRVYSQDEGLRLFVQNEGEGVVEPEKEVMGMGKIDEGTEGDTEDEPLMRKGKEVDDIRDKKAERKGVSAKKTHRSRLVARLR